MTDPSPAEELHQQSRICRTISSKLDQTCHAYGTQSKITKMRPLYLYVLRMFRYMDERHTYNRFLRSCYRKTTEFIPIVRDEMGFLAQNDPDEAKKHRYMQIFTKNMENFRTKCFCSALAQYSKIPGDLPLDLRSLIVSYIAYVPMSSH